MNLMNKPVPPPANLPSNAEYYSMTDLYGVELGESDPTYDWSPFEPITIRKPLMVIGLRIPKLNKVKRFQASERSHKNFKGGRVCVLSRSPDFGKIGRITRPRRVARGSMFRTNVIPSDSGDIMYVVYRMANILYRRKWTTSIQMVLR